MTADETVPNAGSQVGRYVLIRQVAEGALGPLYIAEREVGEGVNYGLVRVVPLPAGLPAQDEHALADAIWDSTNVAHDLVLRVADVVTGNGWLALVHEHSEGSLVDYLQNLASETQSAFPAKVASRMALDVIESLEQSRDHCATANKPWRSGNIAPGSLLLGPDGRVRALDGQMAAAALRVPIMRAKPGATAFAAPEALDGNREVTERSDVFSVGVMLWELLTGKKLFNGTTPLELGRGFKVPKVAQSVPEGVKVPQGLVHTVHTALEAEPMKRQASLRELAVAIVMGVEEVATYDQVVAFTDSLLMPSAHDDDQPTVLVTALGFSPLSEGEAAATAPSESVAAEPAPAVIAPTEGDTAGPMPAVVAPNETAAAAPASAAIEPGESAATPSPEAALPDGANVPLLDRAPSASAASSENLRSDDAPSPVAGEEPEQASPSTPAPQATAPSADVPLLDRPPQAPAASASVPLLEHAPSITAASSHVPLIGGESPLNAADAPPSAVDAPAKPREKMNTLPGHGSLPPEAESRPSVPAPSQPHSEPQASRPLEPFRLVTDEPFVPVRVQPVHTIDSSKPSAPEEPAPLSGAARVPSVRPVASVSSSDIPEAPKKRTLQLSVGTLVFGFSTTVLAVIVIMLVLQRSSSNSGKEPQVAPAVAASVSTALPSPVAASAQAVLADPSPITVKQPDAGAAVNAVTKADNRKKSGKDQKTAKSSAPDEAPSDSKGQVPGKHYVPNEL